MTPKQIAVLPTPMTDDVRWKSDFGNWIVFASYAERQEQAIGALEMALSNAIEDAEDGHFDAVPYAKKTLAAVRVHLDRSS